MIEYIRNWYQRHFSDPQVVILALFIIVGFAIVLLAGDLLAPLLASIVIAYVLDGAVEILRRGKIPRFLALGIVFFGFHCHVASYYLCFDSTVIANNSRSSFVNCQI